MPSMSKEIGYLVSDGARLHYTVDGRGPPIVLLHCLPMDRRVWMHQTFDLAADHSTIALDFPGLGLSEKLAGPSSIETRTVHVRNLLDHLEIARSIVMGISIGAAVAQQFAVSFPERTEALVLSGSGCSSMNDAVQNKFTGRIAGYSSKDSEAYYETHLRSLFSDYFLSTPLAAAIISNYMSVSKRVDFPSIALLFQALKKFDLEREIAKVRVPTLVISGEKDRAFHDSKKICGLIPGSRFVGIPNAGHAVCIETPLQFNHELRAFLANAARK